MTTGLSHVTQLYAIFEDEKKLYLVIEYLKGGTLKSYLLNKPITSDDMVRNIIKQLLIGLE